MILSSSHVHKHHLGFVYRLDAARKPKKTKSPTLSTAVA
jgi:hypothetical protein